MVLEDQLNLIVENLKSYLNKKIDSIKPNSSYTLSRIENRKKDIEAMKKSIPSIGSNLLAEQKEQVVREFEKSATVIRAGINNIDRN